MVPFGDHAIAVIGGQSSNLTIQDEIHVFRRVLLLCHKIREAISDVIAEVFYYANYVNVNYSVENSTVLFFMSFKMFF